MPDSPSSNSLDDFFGRFDDLCKEAKQHGIERVAVLVEVNQLGCTTSLRIVHKGNFYAAIGALESARLSLLRRESEGTE
jgi:hypothetical protein